MGLVNATDRIMGLIDTIHKRDANVLKTGLKLSQNRLAEVLGGNAGSIRNNENNTGFVRHGFGLKVRVSTTITRYRSMPHFEWPLDQFPYLLRVFYVQPTATK
jgi:hypothetical protein